jgi:hypothetical protein
MYCMYVSLSFVGIPAVLRSLISSLVLHRCWLLDPESVLDISDKAKSALCDVNPCVMAASLCLFTGWLLERCDVNHFCSHSRFPPGDVHIVPFHSAHSHSHSHTYIYNYPMIFTFLILLSLSSLLLLLLLAFFFSARLDLIKAKPRVFKDAIGSFVSILKQVSERALPASYEYHRLPSPWIQIRLLKILAMLGENDQRSVKASFGDERPCE